MVSIRTTTDRPLRGILWTGVSYASMKSYVFSYMWLLVDFYVYDKKCIWYVKWVSVVITKWALGLQLLFYVLVVGPSGTKGKEMAWLRYMDIYRGITSIYVYLCVLISKQELCFYIWHCFLVILCFMLQWMEPLLFDTSYSDFGKF